MKHACFRDRYDLLNFLLINTAAVRQGIKPGELLRIGQCPWGDAKKTENGMCVYQKEALDAMKMPYFVLRTNAVGVLVMFYSPEKMHAALENERTSEYMSEYGYGPSVMDTPSPSAMVIASLETLRWRFSVERFPHEVGIFLGYPLKDVVGFMRQPGTLPTFRGAWQVYGDPKESLALMQQYKNAAKMAETLLRIYRDHEICMTKIAEMADFSQRNRQAAG